MSRAQLPFKAGPERMRRMSRALKGGPGLNRHLLLVLFLMIGAAVPKGLIVNSTSGIHLAFDVGVYSSYIEDPATRKAAIGELWSFANSVCWGLMFPASILMNKAGLKVWHSFSLLNIIAGWSLCLFGNGRVSGILGIVAMCSIAPITTLGFAGVNQCFIPGDPMGPIWLMIIYAGADICSALPPKITWLVGLDGLTTFWSCYLFLQVLATAGLIFLCPNGSSFKIVQQRAGMMAGQVTVPRYLKDWHQLEATVWSRSESFCRDMEEQNVSISAGGFTPLKTVVTHSRFICYYFAWIAGWLVVKKIKATYMERMLMAAFNDTEPDLVEWSMSLLFNTLFVGIIFTSGVSASARRYGVELTIGGLQLVAGIATGLFAMGMVTRSRAATIFFVVSHGVLELIGNFSLNAFIAERYPNSNIPQVFALGYSATLLPGFLMGGFEPYIIRTVLMNDYQALGWIVMVLHFLAAALSIASVKFPIFKERNDSKESLYNTSSSA